MLEVLRSVQGSTLIAVAALGIIAGIPLATIDHDEGFFFQPAMSAAAKGTFSCPWTEEFLGQTHFIPLNSLVPLLLTPMVGMGEQALWGGRLLSSFAVLVGLVALARLVSPQLQSNRCSKLVLALASTSLPLWLYARFIRPEAYVFLASCLIVYIVLVRKNPCSWVLGGLAGIACLAHGVYGPFVVVFTTMLLLAHPTSSFRERLRIIAGVATGLVFVPTAFYLWYGVAPAKLAGQIRLFLEITPSVTTPGGPIEQFMDWCRSTRGQTHEIPLLVAVAACCFCSRNYTQTPAARAIKWFIVLYFVIAIFIYPKKTLSSACIILPAVVAWVGQCYSVCRKVEFRIVERMLIAALVLNCLLSVRYHWRLFAIQENALAETARLAKAVKTHTGKNAVTILAKDWMIFSLSERDRLYDICIFPVAHRYFSGVEGQVAQVLDNLDAVIIEVLVDGQAIDAIQADLLSRYRKKKWAEKRGSLIRLFTKQDVILLIRPSVSPEE